MKAKQFKAIFDSVDERLSKCWDSLASFREPTTCQVVAFQPELGKALFAIADAYQQIRTARKYLINKKKTTDPEWFTRRQQTFGKMEKALIAARGLGLAMGDAFVWPFFANDRDQLREHAKHPSTDNLQAGVGGMGELRFVESVPVIGNRIILHHSITSLLRIGDVSLVDRNDLKVKGIGELKTYKDNNLLCITLHAVSTDRIPLDGIPKRRFKQTRMLPRQVVQLQNQQTRMKTVISPSEVNKLGGVKLELTPRDTILSDLIANVKVGKSLAAKVNES